MSDIRLRYAGFVAFGARLGSVVTGILFTIIVTRSLSEADFGLWQLIAVVIGYSNFPATVVYYWVTRYIARGAKVARTALYLSSILALLGSILYLLMALPAAETVNAPFFFFLLSLAQVPLFYIASSLDSIAHGLRPQLVSYGFLVFEVSKVITAVVMIRLLGAGLTGAILSLVLAQSLQVVMLTIALGAELRAGFEKNVAWDWVKRGWLPLYNAAAGLAPTFDVLLVAALTHQTVSLAYFRVAMVVSALVSHSSLLTSALYPKILGGGGRRDIEVSLKMLLMLAIPLLVGVFALARTLLQVVKPVYIVAVPILQLTAITAFIASLTDVSDHVITGSERVELNKHPTFKDYVKSRLFLLPTVKYLNAALSLTVLAVGVAIMAQNKASPSDIAATWALIQLITMFPFVAYRWILARRIIHFQFPLKSVGKYVLAAAVMATLLLYSEPLLTYEPSIYRLLPSLTALIAAGAGLYFAVLYVLDEEFRRLVRDIGVFLRRSGARV